MGRYAQRRRSGGGPPGAPTLISIISAVRTTPTSIALDYNGAVISNDFTLTDFDVDITLQNPDGFEDDTGTGFTLTFAGSTNADIQVRYLDSVPNVESPQQIVIT